MKHEASFSTNSNYFKSIFFFILKYQSIHIMGSHLDFTCLFYTNYLTQSIYIVEINHSSPIKKLEQIARTTVLGKHNVYLKTSYCEN